MHLPALAGDRVLQLQFAREKHLLKFSFFLGVALEPYRTGPEFEFGNVGRGFGYLLAGDLVFSVQIIVLGKSLFNYVSYGNNMICYFASRPRNRTC